MKVMTEPQVNWRDHLTVHPVAEMFQIMSADELKELGEDIRGHGIRTPIVIWTSRAGVEFLIDGRNRLDAAALAGLLAIDQNDKLALRTRDGLREIRFARHSQSATLYDNDPYALAVSLNIHRRHLTTEQRRELIEKLIKATPDKSNRQIAKMVGASHPHIGKVRAELESTGDVETVTTSIDTKGRKQPIKKKRRDIDDYLADKRAKKITEKDHPPETTAVSPTESTERQFAVLKDIWRMNNTLRAAWERSNLKAQRRFLQWLDGGGHEIDENETASRKAGAAL